MTGFAIHAGVYVAVNGSLVALWVLGGGDAGDVPTYLTDWSAAREAGFWPLTVMVAWGVALAVHGAVALALAPGRWRRRRARRQREARRHRERLARAAGAPPGGPRSHDPGNAAEGRQWVAVLFTDIVGSTTLAAELGDERWAELLGNHRTVVRAVLAEHGGAEVGTQGDGFLVRFGSPDDAVACAVELQRTLRGERDVEDHGVHVRMGLHAGEVVAADDDVIGSVVNLAARVTDRAAADEILVTEPLADHLTDEHKLADRGLHELKGVARPRHLLAVEY